MSEKKTSNQDVRAQALARYYKNPTYCKTCGKLLEVPSKVSPTRIRRRQYCSKECARPTFAKSFLSEKIVPKPISPDMTKGQLKNQSLTYNQFRCAIRTDASKAYKEAQKPTQCAVCGYGRIQVCHIRAVSAFADTATLAEINHPGNLVGLCPNHHGEFDRGLISIPGISVNSQKKQKKNKRRTTK